MSCWIAQLPRRLKSRSQDEAGDTIEQRMERLAQRSGTDRSRHSRAPLDRRMSRMQDDLKKLHGKIIQAAKRKDETLRRQFQHAQVAGVSRRDTRRSARSGSSLS